MRVIIFCIGLILSVAPVQAFAPGIMGGGFVNQPELVLVDSQAEGSSAFLWHSLSGTADDMAGQWTTSAEYTLARFCIYLDKGDSPTTNLTGKIYSNDATPDPDTLGTLLGTSTNILDPSTITACTCGTNCEAYCFDFDGVSLSSATMYHFVLDGGSETQQIYACTTAGGLVQRGVVSSPWTLHVSNESVISFETYKYE